MEVLWCHNSPGIPSVGSFHVLHLHLSLTLALEGCSALQLIDYCDCAQPAQGADCEESLNGIQSLRSGIQICPKMDSPLPV